MIELKPFICRVCEEESINGSSFHKLCYKCNNKRLNKGVKYKTSPVKKPKDFTCESCGCQTSQGNHFYKLCKLCNLKRLSLIPKKRSKKPKIYRKKPTGEREMFLKIWSERPHVCSNKSCKKDLGKEPRVHYFSHIKPKGKYQELRLVESNVEILCMDCHRQYDFGGL